MFKTVLVANRGEIAVRVMKTLRGMGIRTVAVYSDADAGARHVLEADVAVRLGPANARESYLAIDKVVAACLETGAEAVHPGYGFLSEKREFQEALAKAGIAFIGPDAHAIQAMGDKIESKKLAKAAGVSTVPGYLGVIETDNDAVQIARIFKEAGADLIDCSSGQVSKKEQPVYGRMFQTPFADRVRNEAGIATIAVGAISEADHVNSIIAAGRADLCAVARPHLANPAWTLQEAAKIGYTAMDWPAPYLSGKSQMETLIQRERAAMAGAGGAAKPRGDGG